MNAFRIIAQSSPQFSLTENELLSSLYRDMSFLKKEKSLNDFIILIKEMLEQSHVLTPT